MTTQPQLNSTGVKLGQITQAGFGTILLMMLGMGVVAKTSMNTLVKSNEWISHTYSVIAELKQLEKDLVDAETGQRGFIYSGKESFLEPYLSGTRQIKTDFASLEKLIKDNPQQIQRLGVVEQAAQKKLDELAETIALKRQRKEQALRELVLSGKGKQAMDDIRRQLDQMVAIENSLLQERQQVAMQAERFSTLASIGGTSLAVLIGLGILLFIAKRIVQPINQVASTIASSSTEISATVAQQERIASQQAASVNETTTTMDQLNSSSRQSAHQAEMADQGAQQALHLAQHGTEAVSQTLQGMTELKIKVEAIADQILRLSEQTNQIGNINNLVSDLANQTNMLALNAAVEAVRAGEHGKGFAVVAGEIRKLADQSKKSAEKINSLVRDIQTAINTTVLVTDEGTKTVEAGALLAQTTASAFTGVADAINQVVVNSRQISLNANQQAIAIQQVVEAMNALNFAARETAAGISQTRDSTLQLQTAAQSLKAIV